MKFTKYKNKAQVGIQTLITVLVAGIGGVTTVALAALFVMSMLGVSSIGVKILGVIVLVVY